MLKKISLLRLVLIFVFSVVIVISAFSFSVEKTNAATLSFSPQAIDLTPSPSGAGPYYVNITAPTGSDLQSYLSSSPADEGSGTATCNGYGYGYYDPTYSLGGGDAWCSSNIGYGQRLWGFPGVNGGTVSVHEADDSLGHYYWFNASADEPEVILRAIDDSKGYITGVKVSMGSGGFSYSNYTYNISFLTYKYQWTYGNGGKDLKNYGYSKVLSPASPFAVNMINNITMNPSSACLTAQSTAQTLTLVPFFNGANIDYGYSGEFNETLPSVISNAQITAGDNTTLKVIYTIPANTSGSGKIDISFKSANTSFPITVKPIGQVCGQNAISGDSSITINAGSSGGKSYSADSPSTSWYAEWVGSTIPGVSIVSPVGVPKYVGGTGCNGSGGNGGVSINSNKNIFQKFMSFLGINPSKVYADVSCWTTVYPIGANQTLKISSAGSGSETGTIMLHATASNGDVSTRNITVNVASLDTSLSQSTVHVTKGGPVQKVTATVNKKYVNMGVGVSTFNEGFPGGVIVVSNSPENTNSKTSDISISTTSTTNATPGTYYTVTVSASGTNIDGTSISAPDTYITVIVDPSSVVNGTCSSPAVHYTCATGTSDSPVNGATAYTWVCQGSGDGHTDASCSENKTIAVNGACSSPAVHYTCAAGTSASNVSGATTWTWNCNGSNGGTTSPQCSESKPIPYPDLTAGVVSPIAAEVNTPVSFTSVIKNQGNASTLNNTPYTDYGGFYNLFQVTDTDPGSVQAGGSSQSNLFSTSKAYASGVITDISPSLKTTQIIDAGGSITVTASSYKFTSAGTYYVRACADKSSAGNSGLITESNENNNCGSWVAVTVNPQPPVPLPNLTAGAVSPTVVTVNVATNFTAYVYNVGSVSSGKVFYNFFQVTDTDPNPSSVGNSSQSNLFSTPKVYASGVIIDLPPKIMTPPLNSGSNAIASLLYPYAFTTTGTHWMRACADMSNSGTTHNSTPPDSVVESKENDNCGSWTPIIVDPVPPTPMPDLTADTVTPTTAIAGTSQSYSADITNSGNLSTGKSFSYFFQQASASNGNGYVSSQSAKTMSKLEAGESGVATSLPISIATGANIISVRVCADLPPYPNGVITESNTLGTGESNNCGPWQDISIKVNPNPVNGVWGSWSPYSQCPTDCGQPAIKLTRTCIGPFNGGIDCVPDADGTSDTLECGVTPACPPPDIDGSCLPTHYKCGAKASSTTGVNQKSNLDTWTWDCPGQGNGATKQCVQNKKKPGYTEN